MHRDHRLQQTGLPCNGEYGFIARIELPEDQVVAQGAGKQAPLLLDIAHVFGQHRFGEMTEIDVVEQDAPLLRLVHPRQQAQQGGLARADRPQHADLFSGADDQTGQRQRLLRAIARHHALKTIVTADARHHDGLFLAVVVVLQGPQAIQPLQRRLCMRPLHQLPGDHRHRCQHPPRQDRTGNQAAHRHLTAAHQQCASGDHQGIRNLLQRAGQMLRVFANVAHLQIKVASLISGFHPTGEHAPAALARLDALGPFDGFHQQAGFLIAGGV